MQSDIGINPTNDGKVIRLVFPELTEERRKELVKDVKKKGEAAKVAIRNIRRDANDTLKKANKNNEITEDELKDQQDKVQKATDKHIKTIDGMIDKKSQEILTVQYHGKQPGGRRDWLSGFSYVFNYKSGLEVWRFTDKWKSN